MQASAGVSNDGIAQDVRPNSEPAARLYGIDDLRGIAAIGVALFHVYSQNLSEEDRLLFPSYVHLPIMWGRWGVQLFFIISGFVIVYTLHNRRDFNKLSDVLLYFLRRIVRLDILYIVVLIAAALYSITKTYSVEIEWIDWYAITKNVFYFLPIDRTLLLPVAWTLAIEVQFYVAMAAFYVVLNSLGLKRLAFPIIAIVAVVSLLYPMRVINVEIGYWLFPSLFNLLAGSLLYFLFNNRSVASLIVNGLYAVAIFAVFVKTRESHVLATLIGYAGMILFLFVIPSMLTKNAVLMFLGNWSYGIYLTHQLVGAAIVTPLSNASLPFFSTGAAPLVVGMGITVLISYALYRLVEQPSIALSKLIGRRPNER